jgi:hypothetical protein
MLREFRHERSRVTESWHLMIAHIVLTKLSRQFDKCLKVKMSSKSNVCEKLEVLVVVYIAESVCNSILITQVNSDYLGIVGM